MSDERLRQTLEEIQKIIEKRERVLLAGKIVPDLEKFISEHKLSFYYPSSLVIKIKGCLLMMANLLFETHK